MSGFTPLNNNAIFEINSGDHVGYIPAFDRECVIIDKLSGNNTIEQNGGYGYVWFDFSTSSRIGFTSSNTNGSTHILYLVSTRNNASVELEPLFEDGWHVNNKYFGAAPQGVLPAYVPSVFRFPLSAFNDAYYAESRSQFKILVGGDDATLYIRNATNIYLTIEGFYGDCQPPSWVDLSATNDGKLKIEWNNGQDGRNNPISSYYLVLSTDKINESTHWTVAASLNRY